MPARVEKFTRRGYHLPHAGQTSQPPPATPGGKQILGASHGGFNGSHIEESTRHQLLAASLSKGPSSFAAPQIPSPDLPEEVQTRSTCPVVASSMAVLVWASTQFSLKFGRSRLGSKPSGCRGHCATLILSDTQNHMSPTRSTDAA